MFPAPVIRTLYRRSGGAIQFERRLHRRYQISLDLDYKLLHRRRTMCEGRGRTMNISSHGVLFKAKRFLRGLSSIELSIDWPVPLKGLVPSKLVVNGRVVREAGRTIAVNFIQHEFRNAIAPDSEGCISSGSVAAAKR